jgi:heme a synthase
MTATDKKQIQIWYWTGASLVFLILIIGGITRLTGSGLSMTDWRPIMGAVPPLTESQWLETFDEYKQFPEYQLNNRGMSLAEFQFIFFWEYLHRMAGRFLGLVFIVPFAWFLIRKKMDARQLRRALLLMGLGLGQALMGWYMVQSGLVDDPVVSPFRLAAHLLLAFLITGLCIWFALDLQASGKQRRNYTETPKIRGWLWLFMGVLILQITWGAFVAGHQAGQIYNTFPKMGAYWVPPELWALKPAVANFFQNISTVQWTHRVLGTLLGVLAVGVMVIIYRNTSTKRLRRLAAAILGLVLVQYGTGVLTLIWKVPVWLGVTHQALAMILFAVVIGALHQAGRKPHRSVHGI